MKTWLKFDEVDRKSNAKTKVWTVSNNTDGSILGSVKWKGSWRQYTFTNWNGRYGIPSDWNKDCLRELANFIEEEMNKRKI